MEIYFVMDIKDGKAVGGKSGKREDYAEVDKFSRIVRTSDPVKIVEELKPKNAYIADLDRIEKRGNNSGVIYEVSKRVERLIADQGYESIEEARGLSWTPVLGTETFDVRRLEDGDYIVSVDVKESLLDKSGFFSRVEGLIEFLNTFRLQAIIVLPIHSVGTLSYDFSLVEKAIELSDHRVITGGGISSYKDLERLKEMGVDGVLIATAFHRGLLDPELLKIGRV